MILSSPYGRSFAFGAAWYGVIAIKLYLRHPDATPNYASFSAAILLIAWALTALLLGVLAARFQRLRAWWGIGLGTLGCSVLVMNLMLYAPQWVRRAPQPPQFASTDEMMKYLAAETSKWVKHDRGIDLDYSVESVKTIEEELDRISKQVNKANPEKGTFGLALGYGAYIGEVFRRRNGGTWKVDDATVGPRSFPLATTTNGVIYPVGWCWKRLTVGDENNVFHKALAFMDYQALVRNATNDTGVLLLTNRTKL
jgi:hypothetical protein